MEGFEIRGVPCKLASDAWWFSDEAGKQGDAQSAPAGLGDVPLVAPVAAVTLALLVYLADMLFWNHPVGVSLLAFSAALTGAAVFNLRPQLTGKDFAFAAILWVVSAAPVVEYVQVSSVLLMVSGHCVVLAFLATRARGGVLVRKAVLVAPMMMRFALARLISIARRPRRGATSKPRREMMLAWLMPALIGIVFASLFLQANPLLWRWAADLASFDPTPETVLRALFLAVVAALALPFVLFKSFAPMLRSSTDRRGKPANLEGRLINARSVTNALILFNGLFLLQNATDLAVLWAGIQLPDGMTYAEYAHQGAYPLMATSALAGAFAVVSQRYVADVPVLRAVLLLWIVQNILLAASALGRLDLYMYAYGLTYLRLRAAIGMALVIAGMALLGWQIWRGYSNGWTFRLFAALLVATFYIGSFVNFGNIIVSANLGRDGTQIDDAYICKIGPLGAKARSKANFVACPISWHRHTPEGWRDWSWRMSRLTGYSPITILSDRDMGLPNS